MTKLQMVADAVRKAARVRQCFCCGLKHDNEPVRSDVLLAMNQKNLMVGVMCSGSFYDYVRKEFIKMNEVNSYWWNLRNDNLSAQSEECVAFLHSLLCV